MKVKIARKIKSAASALLTALVICSIFSLFIMYYLSLVEQQHLLSDRSTTWNLAITVTEAGIEDGMQQVNANWPTYASDGWSALGGGTYYRSNYLGNGTAYTSYIYSTNNNPVVVARSYVQTSAFTQLFAAGGVSTAPVSVTVSRAVCVTTKKGNLFLAAIVAKKNVNLNGNNVQTDSYDSTDPTKSTNGHYDPTKYAGDRGDVASNGGIIGVGNANIYGVAHASSTNDFSVGSQGGIGTHAWQAANRGAIEPGYGLGDANFTFPDTTYPNTGGYMTPTGGVVVVTSNYLTAGASTTYSLNNLPAGGGYSTNVLANSTSSTYPNPAIPPITTNWTMNTTTPPVGTPDGLTTTMVMNSSTLPNPVPAGTTTNTTPNISNKNLPAPGVAGGYVVGSQVLEGNKYTFTQINSFNYPTYSYISSYTYPSSFSIAANVTNTVYFTNTYNTILWGTSHASDTNYYVASSLSGSTLVIGENVVLALPNGLNMSGNDSLTISKGDNILVPNGLPYAPGNLIVYAGGTSSAIGGNGVINASGQAWDFILYCAPSVKTFALNGNGGLVGIVVAPNVDVSLNGGGNSSTTDFTGALMANSVTLNGHFNFHWDEALGNMNKNGRYLVNSWNEIPPTAGH